MTLDRAKELTTYAIDRIGKFCEIVQPAGSVRRECKEVNSVYLILVPRSFNVETTDIFSGGSLQKVISPNFIEAVKTLGKIEKGSPDGRQMCVKIRNIDVDFYMTSEADYYRMLTIRTGSNSFVRNYIPNAWRRLGWVGTDFGLRRPEDCRVITDSNGRRRYEVFNQEGERPPIWQSEQAFFKWLNIEWVEPYERNC